MSRIVRALTATALGAALAATASPAHAVGFCEPVAGQTPCVIVLEDVTYACAGVAVDPMKNVADDVITGYACLADVGAGPQLFTCFSWARRSWLCTR